MMSINQLLERAARAGVFLYAEDEKLKFKLSVDEFPIELKQEIIAQKAELIEFLSAHRDDQKTERPAITVLNRTDYPDSLYPTSFAQRRLWFIDQFEQGSAEYNIPRAIEVTGAFQVDIAEQAIQAIIQRHEALRTVFVEKDGEPRQKILQHPEFSLTRIDLSHLHPDRQWHQVLNLAHADLTTGFALSTDLMLRASYIVLSDLADGTARGVLLFNTHHIASDGWSMSVLIREFVAEYDGLTRGVLADIPDLPVQYTDYAAWQRDWLQGDVLERQLAYWQQQLDDAPVVHQLPLDRSRPAVKQHAGKRLNSELSAVLSKQVTAFAQQHDMTPFMVIHAALTLTLTFYAGQSRFVVGTPVANRVDKKLESLIGFFVNTLVLHTHTEFTSLAEFLAHVRQVNLDAQSHQDIPFEQVVEACSTSRSMQHTPLFQVMLSMNTNESSELSLPGLTFAAISDDDVTAKYDLDVTIQLTEQGGSTSWVFDLSLFDETTVAQFDRHFIQVLDALVNTVDVLQSPGDIQQLSQHEQQSILQQLDGDHTSTAPQLLLHEAFEQHATNTPDALALVAGTERLTYQALNESANRLAHYLVAQGVGPDKPVGVYLTRSVNTIISVLAILKAGGAYVSLDPAYPQERLQYLIEDTGLTLVLTEQALTEQALTKQALTKKTLTGQTQSLALDSEEARSALADYPVTPLARRADPRHLSYLIYTSGSTGKPKGVAIAHRNSSAFIQWSLAYFSQQELSSVLFSTSLNFDLSVFELFAPLSAGGCIVLVKNILDLLEPSFNGEVITLINTVPSGIDAVAQSGRIPDSVMTINLAGEPLKKSLVNRLHEQHDLHRVVNLYGPSEDTTYSTVYEMKGPLTHEPKIGRPVGNTRAYVLSREQQLVPFGVAGELYLGGAGVARGYLNQAAMTAERFVPNPFLDDKTDVAGEQDFARLYRTGDLVRYDAQGELHFLGRLDDQVKIRGFRIEMGEIEHRLNDADSVHQSLVQVNETAGQTRLVAWVEPVDASIDDSTFIDAVRSQLQTELPDYMVPAAFVVIRDWPLLPNGKINKNALPAPDWHNTEQTYQPPETETEQMLVEIESTLLSVPAEQLSVTANFFESGGHSLIAVKLVSAIQQQFAKVISLKAVFEHHSIRQLAAVLDQLAVSTAHFPIEPAADQSRRYFPLSWAQQRLWFIDQLEQGSAEYNMPLAFEISGEFDYQLANTALQAIVARHSSLRTLFTTIDEQAQQHIIEPAFQLTIVHAQGEQTTALSAEQQLNDAIRDEQKTPFDLSRELPIRGRFLVLSASDDKTQQSATISTRGVLLLTMHHIVSDAWSLSILMQEFVHAYQDLTQGKPVELPALPLQYVDYAVWQREMLPADVYDKQLAFWRETLHQLPVTHSIPLDKPRPAQSAWRGRRVSGRINQQQVASLMMLAKRFNLTPFMLYHAVISLVLAKHSTRDMADQAAADIVIGTPVANRTQAGLESVIGFFVNTLVLRLNVGEQSLGDFLAQVRQVNIDAQAHQDVPFEQVVDHCQVTRSTAHAPLFQIMLNMNTVEQGDIALPGLTVTNVSGGSDVAKFDLDIAVQQSDQGATISWIYDTALFEQSRIERLSRHVEQLLATLALDADHHRSITEIECQSTNELETLRVALNQTAVPVDDRQTLQQQIEAIAASNPGAIAVVDDNHPQGLSYQALNQAANRLATQLVDQSMTNERVGVYLSRSANTLVTVLAALKAGLAWVPLDPALPSARIQTIVEDAELSLIVVEHEQVAMSALPALNVTYLDISTVISAAGGETNPPCMTTGDSIAYVLYTSGSTGKPKGVAVYQKGLLNYLSHAVERYWTADIKHAIVSSTLSFDATLTTLLSPLLCGKTVVMLQQEDVIPALTAQLKSDAAGLFKVAPAHLEALSASFEKPVATPHVLVIGGEQLTGQLIQQLQALLPGATFINEYGPTETVVGCCEYYVYPGDTVDSRMAIPIGTPIRNTRLLVLDEHRRPVPFGSVGELYIAGAGVAQGYINRPEQTADAFVRLAHESQAYRTGDLVRYLESGDLVFIGRIDHQIKLRGYRIETAEIEQQINQYPGIRQSVVRVIQSKNVRQLVAWLVGDNSAADITALEQQLAQTLPDYMIPGRFVVVDDIPLTVNGKIDLDKLPQPTMETAQDYLPASNDVEQQLVTLWSGLLNMTPEQLSVTANFFTLGGDSILSIQLVSRAARAGLFFTVKDLFNAQTIRRLAPRVSTGQSVNAEQGDVIGELPLLPVQQDFFLDETDLHHYNQSVLLTTPVDFDADCLPAVMAALVARHDVFRLRFTKTQGEWRAESLPLDGFPFEHIVDLVDGEPLSSRDITSRCDQAQRSLWPENGRLIKAVYMPEIQGEDAGRLLLVIHHLVMDGVSWRILLTDLEQLYRQHQAQQPLQLAAKTSSYQQWSAALNEQDISVEEQRWWQEQHAPESFSFANTFAAESVGSSSIQTQQLSSLSMQLDEATTRQLISQVPQAYNTQINEVLLAALLMATKDIADEFGGESSLRIALESHGRDSQHINARSGLLDLSETIGWFTTIYPLLLSSQHGEPGELLCDIKEHYRAVPRSGLGAFTCLKAVSETHQVQKPELLFNYLGQFDQTIEQAGVFGVAPESSGDQISPNRYQPFGMVMNGKIAFGQLSFTLSYDASVYPETGMNVFLLAFEQGLRTLITHCCEAPRRLLTPTDLPLTSLSRDEVNRWQQQHELIDIYPATGMQQGLLFHSLLAESSYVTQTSVTFSRLDNDVFKQTWQAVIDRQSVFRTAFAGLDQGRAHQLIRRAVDIHWYEEDLQQLSSAEQQAYLAQWLERDRQQGFVIDQAPLMRLALFTLADNDTRFVWSHHHALLDGWSVPLIFQDITACYQAIAANQPLPACETGDYRQYVEWLTQQDEQQSLAFWRQSLEAVEQPTPLPRLLTDEKNIPEKTEFSTRFNQQETASLKALAAASNTTVNVILQAAWSLILAGYNDETMVVFGAVTSGRPAELTDVETIAGLFINTVPVVVDTRGQQTVTDWLQTIHRAHIDREQHSYLPLVEIQKQRAQGQETQDSAVSELFDSLIVFENYPIADALTESAAQSDDPSRFVVEQVDMVEGTNYGLTLVANQTDVLSVRFESTQHAYSKGQLAALADQLHRVMMQLTQHTTHSTVSDIQLLSAGQQTLLLSTFNQTALPVQPDLLLHQAFEQHATNTPDALALIAGTERLTYQALNESANRLAHYLVAQGVDPDKPVGVHMTRSVNTIISVLAILKAGGAYVSLDPAYPQERLQYLIEDTGLTLVLTEQALTEQALTKKTLSGQAQSLALDSEEARSALADYPVTPLARRADPRHLSYLIYTSGSTGKPKGVAIAHSNSSAFIQWSLAYFSREELSSVLFSTSLNFDLSVFELFAPLSAGGCIVLVKNILDLLEPSFNGEGITLINTVPSGIDAVAQSGRIPDSVMTINLAGEPLKKSLVNRLHEQHDLHRVVNLYGPSEDTTYSTVYEMKGPLTHEPKIGRPVGNTRAYVLNREQQLVPFGVAGELYLGGAGVARGYLNQAAMTAERFVPNPFLDDKADVAGEQNFARLYRTGDLVRYDAQGELHFLGRLDDQVKIRGFRIEMGEIEHRLNDADSVHQSLVQVNETTGQARLVAWVEPVDALIDDSSFIDAVRSQLQTELPDYMVPAAFVVIRDWPLLPNGKINKKALPTPTFSQGDQFVAATNDTERTLQHIWQSLLQGDLPGIHDNFFMSGGDSILAIQLVSAARDAGITLSLQDIFDANTIALQAQRAAEAPQKHCDQSSSQGELMLLPIQQHFLTSNAADVAHHYNQSIMLTVPDGLSLEFLEQAGEMLLQRHDVLRLSFEQSGAGWRGFYRQLGRETQGAVVQQHVASGRWDDAVMARHGQQIQSSFSLSDGRLFSMNLLRADDKSRLLLVAHHLIVDGVSWRILVSDLQRLWQQFSAGEPLKLAAKTSSYQQWSQALLAWGNELPNSDVGFWQSQQALSPETIPTKEGFTATSDEQAGLRTDSDAVSITLNETITSALSGAANRTYHTTVNELLLSGLWLALHRQFGLNAVEIALEGHGRETISDQLDLTETVGWFTSLYPLVLFAESSTPDVVIKGIKEHYRQRPENGLSYGVHRYLTHTLPQGKRPQILFNYLGQLDAHEQGNESEFRLSDEPMGSNLHPFMQREFPIAINGHIAKGQLHFTLDYANAHFYADHISDFAEQFKQALQDITVHCQTARSTFTPSDFPYATLTPPQLEHWQQAFDDIEGIYDATSMQQGMFYHTQLQPDAYLTQITLQLTGTLDENAFIEAWQQVSQRHDVFRSVFVGEQQQLLRIVRNNVMLDHQILDWSAYTEDAFHSALTALKTADRAKGFDLAVAPLQRIYLIRQSATQWQMLWTHHHMLLDGWCVPLVYNDVMQAYQAVVDNPDALTTAPPVSLEPYYRWLQQQSDEDATQYWQNYLVDFSAPTPLAIDLQADHKVIASASDDQPVSASQDIHWTLSDDVTQALTALARRHGVTMNTLMQFVWGYLLHRYSGESSVLFGTVVSGRPAEVPNIEQMAGLFINSIPVKLAFSPDQDIADHLIAFNRQFHHSQQFSYLALSDIQAVTNCPPATALFDSLLVFENYPTDLTAASEHASHQGLQVTASETQEHTAYPLTLLVNHSDQIGLTLSYQPQRFDSVTAARVAEHVAGLLEQLALCQKPNDLKLITHDEQQLLAACHDTAFDYDLTTLPHHYVEKLAEQQPEQTAVIDAATGQSLSYQALNASANQLAHYLIEQGVGPNQSDCFVALHLERSLELVIAILATMKAGGAYVPLDTQLPTKRKAFILREISAPVVLTDSDDALILTDETDTTDYPQVVLTSAAFSEHLKTRPTTNPVIPALSEHALAYMIYTSGTTGVPKGVMVEHSALLNRIQWMQRQYQLLPGHRILQKTPYSFDVSVWEFVWPWLAGATLVIAAPEGHKDPDYLATQISQQQISHIHFVPSMLQVFVQHIASTGQTSSLTSLQDVFCSGEALTVAQQQQFFAVSDAGLHNLYGPTEAAIDVTFHACQRDAESTTVPIGKAIDNVQCYVLDSRYRQQPPGIAGELVIAGVGLARGYFHRDELTAEKFIDLPIDGGEPVRVYRTGDLARRLADGSLDFLGRIDHQVKIRGLRIELNEIQSQLEGHPNVEQAAVTAQGEGADQWLTAFIVAGHQTEAVTDETALTHELQVLLRSELPVYMVPAAFAYLDALPLSANGKLDRKQLPDVKPALTSEFIAPETDTEQQITAIWQQVLQHSQPIGVNHSYFELGGNSLQAMQIVSQIREQYPCELAIADLFSFQTVRELAHFIDAVLSDVSEPQLSDDADSTEFDEMEF